MTEMSEVMTSDDTRPVMVVTSTEADGVVWKVSWRWWSDERIEGQFTVILTRPEYWWWNEELKIWLSQKKILLTSYRNDDLDDIDENIEKILLTIIQEKWQKMIVMKTISNDYYDSDWKKETIIVW